MSTSEKWYIKMWEVIKKVASWVWNLIVLVVTLFFKLFNTKTKLAAIALAVYIWCVLDLSLWNKVATFILFAIEMLLLNFIKEDK